MIRRDRQVSFENDYPLLNTGILTSRNHQSTNKVNSLSLPSKTGQKK